MDFEEIILKNNFALFGWVKKIFFFFTLDYKSKGRIQPLSCFKIHVHTHISFFFSNRLIRSAGIYLGKGNLKEKSIVGCCISFFIIVSYLFPMEWLEFIQIKWKFPRFFAPKQIYDFHNLIWRLVFWWPLTKTSIKWTTNFKPSTW